MVVSRYWSRRHHVVMKLTDQPRCVHTRFANGFYADPTVRQQAPLGISVEALLCFGEDSVDVRRVVGGLMRRVSLVFVGGFVGAITRYAASKSLLTLGMSVFGARVNLPYDTLLFNMTGALLLGVLFGFLEEGGLVSPDMRLLMGTGFLGAYTTFSSYATGVVSLAARHQLFASFLYLVGTMVVGVALAHLGFISSRGIVQFNRLRYAGEGDAPVYGEGARIGSTSDLLDNATDASERLPAEVEGDVR
jgi:CrcB protein